MVRVSHPEHLRTAPVTATNPALKSFHSRPDTSTHDYPTCEKIVELPPLEFGLDGATQNVTAKGNKTKPQVEIEVDPLLLFCTFAAQKDMVDDADAKPRVKFVDVCMKRVGMKVAAVVAFKKCGEMTKKHCGKNGEVNVKKGVKTIRKSVLGDTAKRMKK